MLLENPGLNVQQASILPKELHGQSTPLRVFEMLALLNCTHAKSEGHVLSLKTKQNTKLGTVICSNGFESFHVIKYPDEVVVGFWS